MQYEDFVIQVTTDGRGRVVLRVSESSVGESSAVVADSSSPLGQLLEQNRASSWGLDDLVAEGGPERLGQLLFDALFVGPVQHRFLEAVGLSGSQGAKGLRIKLQVDLESPALAVVHALPWEFLYRGEVGSFLALDRRFALVRHLRLPVSRNLPFAPPRLKLLVAVAVPSDRQILDTEKECRQIAASWQSDDAMVVHFLPHATLDRIRQRLVAEEYQGLHFIGHGQIEPESSEGLLLLENDKGEAAPCTGRDLAIQLADRISLRWVFLNACWTANSSIRRPFGGVATALLRTGVPAVVAMQRPVSDRAAVAFSHTVYQRLAAGDGIDTAVSEGRLAIHRNLSGSSEWATPVLFLRSVDGMLFRREVTRPPSAPAAGPPGAKRRGRWRILASVLLLVGLVALNTVLPQLRSSMDEGHSRTTDTGSETVTVREGEVITMPGFGARVSLSFDDSLGTSFARLTVSLGNREAVDKAFMAPMTVDLGEGKSLRILTIDWQRRQVQIVPIEAIREE